MSTAEEQGPPVLDWRNAVGDFILAFGACEYWTHTFIRDFGPTVVHEAAATMELAPRAALAKAIIIESASPELTPRVEQIFTSLAALAKWRNLVVHNAPSFVTPQQVMTLAEARMHVVSARQKATKLTLPQLRTHVRQAETLVKDMWALYLAVSPPHPGKPAAVFSDEEPGV